MAWVVTENIDSDKTNVGTVTAVFTDTDSTTFVWTERGATTLAAANTFVANAVAGRNAWQAQKARQTTAMTTLAARFVAAGETATAGISV